jgi:putative phosphoesterase
MGAGYRRRQIARNARARCGTIRPAMHDLLYLRSVGVVGDIHAEDQLLETAIELLRARGVDLLIATGDIADGPGSVEACCRQLAAADVLVVRGNHDRWFLGGRARDLPDATQPDQISEASVAYLRSLPPTLEIQTPHGMLLLCHGLGANDMAQLKQEDEGYALQNNADLQQLLRRGEHRFIVGGHTHRPMVRHFGAVAVLNPGTLLRGEQPGFMVLDFEGERVQLYRFTDGAAVEVALELPLLGPTS